MVLITVSLGPSSLPVAIAQSDKKLQAELFFVGLV